MKVTKVVKKGVFKDEEVNFTTDFVFDDNEPIWLSDKAGKN
jgi:hypothetical protein